VGKGAVVEAAYVGSHVEIGAGAVVVRAWDCGDGIGWVGCRWNWVGGMQMELTRTLRRKGGKDHAFRRWG
jgi:serine acetyltransferase